MTRSPRSAAAFADLLERDGERELAAAALADLSDGSGAVLVFEGPAGAGKTALLQAVCHEAAATGATVLSARGVELEQALASGIVGQLFLPPLMTADRDELLAGPAALAAPALGLAPTVAVTDPIASALHGLYWLCANLAERGPLVLAVDDAHWVDDASLRFLAYLIPRLAGLPLLLLIAARPAEPGADSTVLDLILRDVGETVRRPAPLSAAAAARLIRTRAGAASDALCDACHEQSGGNPFLLHELVEALLDAGVDLNAAGPAAVADFGPESVAGSVVARLERLTPDAVAVARAIALFPAGAEVRHVIALAGCDAVAAATAIEQLTLAAILAPGRPLTFLHPVIRSALYQRISAVRRGRMHAAAADLLRTEGAPAIDIAVHHLASDPGMDPEAFGELVAAAQAVLGAGAPASAVRFSDRALAEPVDDARAVSALLLRGGARMMLGDFAADDDLRAAADRAPAGALRATALLQLGQLLGLVLERPEGADALDAAIAECGEDEAVLAGQCRFDRSWVLVTQDVLAHRFVAEMQALPSQPQGRNEQVLLAHWLAWQCEDASRVVELARRALVFDGDDFGYGDAAVLAYGTFALLLADEPAHALDVIGAATARAQRCGDGRAVASLYAAAAGACIYAGDLADAEADLEFAAAPFGDLAAAGSIGAMILASRAVIALEREGVEAAERLLVGLEPQAAISGMMVRAARGRIHLAAARAEEALADLEAARSAARMRGLRNPFYPFPWGADTPLAAAAAGDAALALRLADSDLAEARAFGARGVLGSALRVAGLVRGDVALLREAVEVLRESSARLEEARALTDLGAALRRANQRAAARAPLREALDLAHRCGAAVLAARATEELRASGGRVRRAYVTGVEALTPAERRVATMAASGLSNRQIAQGLFVTLRTVEMHMTHAYAKLGISTRDELARLLASP